MRNELQTTENLTPPEKWTTYGSCEIRPKSLIEGNENPYRITAKDRNDARSALDEIGTWLAPASMESLVTALSELYLLTARASEGSEDRKTLVALYARKLRDYPGDLALDAIRNYRGKFFPAFEELRENISADDRLITRYRMQRALASFVSDDEPGRQGPEPTPEQIARNEAYVREARGDDPPALSPEKLERLAEVDRVHGDAAKAKSGNWRKPPTPDTKQRSDRSFDR